MNKLIQNTPEHDGCKDCMYEDYTAESTCCQGCTQNSVDKYICKTDSEMKEKLINELNRCVIERRDSEGHKWHNTAAYWRGKSDGIDAAIKLLGENK